MGDRFYTGTFQVERPLRTGMRGGSPMVTVHETKLFVDLHPAVYEMLNRGGFSKAPVLLQHAEIDGKQAEGIEAAYKAMGHADGIVSLQQLHARVEEELQRASKSGTEEWQETAARKLKAVEDYAEAMGVDLDAEGPRP